MGNMITQINASNVYVHPGRSAESMKSIMDTNVAPIVHRTRLFWDGLSKGINNRESLSDANLIGFEREQCQLLEE